MVYITCLCCVLEAALNAGTHPSETLGEVAVQHEASSPLSQAFPRVGT